MLRPRLLAVPVLLLLAVSVTGCGVVQGVQNTIRQVTSAGGADSPSSPAPNTRVTVLKSGDCFMEPDDDAPTKVARVACRTEHDDEVTAVVAVPGDDFPGDLRVDKLGQIDCRDALVAFDGRDFATSSLDYWYYVPDATTWNRGMTSIVCYAYSWDGDELTGTVRGAKL